MARNQQYVKTVRSQLEDEISNGRKPENVFWEVVDAVSAVIDGATDTKICSSIAGGVSAVHGTISHRKSDVGLTPNPFFVWNQHDGQTKYTKKYLRNTSRKAIGASVFSLGGNIASAFTQVDITGSAVHLNAGGSTLRHWCKLKSIADSHTKSRTISQWLDVVMRMKEIKMGLRQTQLMGAAIPNGAVGIITGIGAAAARAGVKLTQTNVCLATAAEIHWRAHLEQKVSGFIFRGGGGGAKGPAGRIVHELFTHRGVGSFFFSNYDADKLIKEPSGWMAISHKLLQM